MKPISDPTRTIHIPLSGYVDITGMEGITSHPFFARLRFRRELGFTCMVKPGGLHSRLEHSVGTLHTMRAILERFHIEKNTPLYRALEVYALLHDLGHGPTSHELEYVLPDDHEKKGVAKAEQMRSVIAEYADVDILLALMRGEHPWHVLVKHKTFGADKLDYLERDAYHLGYEIAMNKGKIINCLQFQDGTFGIDGDAMEEIITNLSNYQRMYLEVYLHRSVQMFARIYQRALMESVESGVVDANAVWDMVDHELHARLMHHPLMQRITDRQMLATVACLKLEGFQSEELYQSKGGYLVRSVPLEKLMHWSEFIHRAENIILMEREIERLTGCPEHSVFLVQTDSLKKLSKPPDIQIYSHNVKDFRSLYETAALSKEDFLRRIYRAYYLCIMTTPEMQEKVRKLNLVDFVEKWIDSIEKKNKS